MGKAPSPAAPAGGEPDPSMDDILASIRRILDDDQAGKTAGGDVLVLDPSMMVEEGTATQGEGEIGLQSRVVEPPPTLVDVEEREHTIPVTDEPPSLPPSISREAAAPPAGSALVAPEAAAAAAQSVGALMRTLAAERSASVSRSGVTIEDLVREEVRPLLKGWLDTHLPPIVERLVQAEIERVVGRQAG